MRTKRRKLLVCWAALQAGSSIFTYLLLLLAQQQQALAGIVPPPWSDPAKNPCASMAGGWQLLYWTPLKKCFKIFTLGYPCPDTMELSPTPISAKRKDVPAAECRCPPGTALSPISDACHKLYERGPCQRGEYFQPLPEQAKRADNRWGSCKRPLHCEDGMLFWPKDGKCYPKHSKGPCIRGKLLARNEDGLAECRCEDVGELRPYYYTVEESCYEHYTIGPCSTPGHIFLPGGRCDCQRHLPHYHAPHQMCYELDTPGPCPPGHVFRIPDDSETDQGSDTLLTLPHAKCLCKEGYVPWSDGHCYRLYTRGPCAVNEFVVNETSCIRNFCGKNRLYFPAEDSCYRIGSQGPCSLHQVVVFDFTARPSVDGISYNGMCGCAGVITNLDQQCSASNDQEKSICEATPGMVEMNGQCHKLYSRGPCGAGQWLEPLKTQSTNGTSLLSYASKAKCVCRPGYTPAERMHGGTHNCSAPSVSLARYLTIERLNSKFLTEPNNPLSSPAIVLL
ncbi:uncharacterized protein LOC135432954 isoform X1 [Drosophila montana]|uniref:uncharacterized protein LOC135432954 isoform X1 n=1 Tax=Drosophila montana TaxID=40370 RepID=UPI00313C751E